MAETSLLLSQLNALSYSSLLTTVTPFPAALRLQLRQRHRVRTACNFFYVHVAALICPFCPTPGCTERKTALVIRLSDILKHA